MRGPNRSCAARAIGTAALPAAMTRIGPTGTAFGADDRAIDQTSGVDGSDAGADDGEEILSKCVERTSQCECFGSDQAERPVTTSNCFRSDADQLGSVLLVRRGVRAGR